MFTESMLESGLHRPAAHRWTPLASFAFQSVLVAAMALFPILRNEGLPLVSPRPPVIQISTIREEPRPEPPRPTNGHAGTAFAARAFEQPREIPRGVPQDPTDVGPPVCTTCFHAQSGPFGPAFPIGVGPGPVVRGPEPAKRVIVSEINLGQIVHKVMPVYPEIARRVGIQGEVVMVAVIGRDGTVEALQVKSGPPMLVPAASEAVRQWRYRPFRLNGETIEVETQITVRFAMNR